ncbi:XisI protein [Okeania sp.]|uniref:XisI protein n=1 Tax=Okeania sp. TaxID=3100323 RepID=UPI002B4B6DF0|nr:XisI protein [Okeania sp.]MEB3339942.1 XisI protein [Okeania sp.]
MDKLEKYRNYIKKILTEYHEWVLGAANLDRESCLVFDEIHDQYFWLFMGWEGKKKIRNIQVHIRIKNEKIYIEEDWTESGMANELLRENVSKEDIVLAFHDPESRKLTDFAVV